MKKKEFDNMLKKALEEYAKLEELFKQVREKEEQKEKRESI